MTRVLVPLDGTPMAESILPDARRLAGPNGELILVQDVMETLFGRVTSSEQVQQTEIQAHQYLEAVAESLRAKGARVIVQTMSIYDVSRAIAEGARLFHADYVACATHGRSQFGRLIRGSVAWKVLAHSTIPVMLRQSEMVPHSTPDTRRVLVPLDGSALAETALPLARMLAVRWNAPLYIIRVVSALPATFGPYVTPDVDRKVLSDEITVAEDYVRQVGGNIGVDLHTYVTSGPVVSTIIAAVEEWKITDIVMASHGRTGLPRAILGSVTDDLVRHLHIPILVVPALAASNVRAVEIEEASFRTLAGSASR